MERGGKCKGFTTGVAESTGDVVDYWKYVSMGTGSIGRRVTQSE